MSSTTQSFLPPKLVDLFFEPDPVDGHPVYIPSRYKVAYGGRGSAKSWGFAALASVLATQSPLRVLCAREYQSSIKDSLYRLLCDRIQGLGLTDYFEIKADSIIGRQVWKIQDENGVGIEKKSEFIFAGIKTDPLKIKSFEGADLCLVEEAERVSKDSWKYLINTIRGSHNRRSEIWIVFNPGEETDETYQRFVLKSRRDMRRVLMNWDDNPWFPPDLQAERLADLAAIEEAQATGDEEIIAQAQAEYDHVWEGACQKNAMAAIFRRRVKVHDFEDLPAHLQHRLFLGSDFGFANDPTTLIRSWVTEHESAVVIPETGELDRWQELWISHEAFGWRVEIDESPRLYDMVPGARSWPIKADASQPQTISYLQRQGFNIVGAEKWPGSVEDGIAHLKAFRIIHIHTRCKEMQKEARLYSYKVDRITKDILPVIVDAWNHGWDAVRYSLDGYIQKRGVSAEWERLGQ